MKTQQLMYVNLRGFFFFSPLRKLKANIFGGYAVEAECVSYKRIDSS